MRDYRIRTDIQRVVIDGFAFPLGYAPKPDEVTPPTQGYTLTYNVAEMDETDTYSFHVVVSHQHLKTLLHTAFSLLPEHVYGIVEIGSRDAYRSLDTYLGADEPLSKDEFLQVWNAFESFLIEDSAIAAGANAEEPFVEVFLDQWKGVMIHVPAEMKPHVEQMLNGLGIEEVPETWHDEEDEQSPSDPWDDALEDETSLRPVLDVSDEFMPDVDELLLQLRHAWKLELNVDPRTNIDEAGRPLGQTLWHAVVLVDDASGNANVGAYCDVWATAGSLAEVEQMILDALAQTPEWTLSEIFTIDRVAFDERPDTLVQLTPADRRSRIHSLTFDRWHEPPSTQPPSNPPPTNSSEASRHQ